MKIKALVFCFFIVPFMLSQWVCAQPNMDVVDIKGRKVKVPFNPGRIVCIGPGTLRLVVYLKSIGKVVGVEDMEKKFPVGRPYWLANLELATLPTIGPGGPKAINKKPDFEAVLKVAPDLILASYMDSALADTIQNTIGIPVILISYGGFAVFDETVFKSLQLLGKVLNADSRAREVVNYIQSLQNDLHQRTLGVVSEKQPRVYIGGIGFRGQQGIESSEKKYQPLKWINTENTVKNASAVSGSHVFLTKEKLLMIDPEVIFVDGGGLRLIERDFRKNRSYYNSLSAFEKHRVYSLHPFNWYTTNIGTAVIDGYAMGKILYPDCFKDIDLEEKADMIYQFLTGKAVYGKMKATYGKIGRVVPFL